MNNSMSGSKNTLSLDGALKGARNLAEKMLVQVGGVVICGNKDREELNLCAKIRQVKKILNEETLDLAIRRLEGKLNGFQS